MSEDLDAALRERLQKLVDDNPVVLFMKGTRLFPRCGFSATVVEVLKREGVTDFVDVDVLKDPDVRAGVKVFTNWPTIPQLYVNGKFVGGCDIVRDMHLAGELGDVLAKTE